MIKISVCYSNKNGQEFASASINEIELDPALLLNDPGKILDAIAGAYDVVEQAVHLQLGTSPDSPAGPPVVNPALSRANQSPPPPASSPAPPPAVGPPANGHTFYGNGKRASGAPTNAKSFSGWVTKGDGKQYQEKAKKLCQALEYPTWFMNLTDDQAMHVYGLLTAPATNGTPH